MPLDNRDYTRGTHPPSCTCVGCTERRLRRLRKEAHPDYISVCPKCGKKSLFYNGQARIFECLNLRCKASGRTLSEFMGSPGGYITREETNRVAAFAAEVQRRTSYRGGIPTSHKVKPRRGRKWLVPILIFGIILVLFGIYWWSDTQTTMEVPPTPTIVQPTPASPEHATPPPPVVNVPKPEPSPVPKPEPVSIEPTLRNPSWEELKVFLLEDNTDKMKYVFPTTVCQDFAEKLQKNAKEAGWRCAFVSVRLEGYPDWFDYGIPSDTGHACNAFETTDRGLVYIDVTRTPGAGPLHQDKIVDVDIGKDYTPKSIFPEFGWGEWDNAGTIVGIEVVRW